MKHLLEVDHISVSFATPRGPVEAVHGVSFYLDEGEMVGIVGESGCGKSVTSQTVMKLLPPSVSKLRDELFGTVLILKTFRNGK